MDCTRVETVRFGLGNKVALAVCLILLFAGLFFANYRENGGELLGVNIFKRNLVCLSRNLVCLWKEERSNPHVSVKGILLF